MSRISWPPVVEHAAAIVRGYDTPVTLRQVFYRLVADGTLPNTSTAYKTLSSRTAEARREGTFPDLSDNTREVSRHRTFDGPYDALRWLQRIYRRDRTEGQEHSVYLGVEKATMVAQLESWFGKLGLPVVACRGYVSQTLADEVRQDATGQGRPAVLLYAGDFDPSGEDIHRDFVERAACFDEVVRVALTPEQVADYGLPPQPGKRTDSRAEAFEERHGALVQVELEAMDPADLRDLYRQALQPFWDSSVYDAARATEDADREALSP